MELFIETLEKEFFHHQNKNVAAQQKAYLRDQFEFFGLKAAERRSIQKPFLMVKYLPQKEGLNSLILNLWKKPQRDFQYVGQELVFKYSKKFDIEDILLLEFMVTHKSWWDTVDYIAVKLLGAYFKIYPEQRIIYIEKWLKSDNIWLQRSALLFQLKYKNEIDTQLLAYAITSLLGSKEFFINKAIGWVLREYSRTNPKWVIDFVAKKSLSTLSKKEALRLVEN